MSKGGVVTRKDMFSDDAMKFGEDYAKQLKAAIDANEVLINSVKELNKQVQNFKGANNQKDYISAKQAETLETQKAIDAIKKKEAAELSMDKIQRSRIATMEVERKAKQATLDAESKVQKAKEASKKLTLEERIQNELNNKVLKQEALERLGLVGSYTKLNKARTDAKNTLRDLIASESASTAEIEKARKAYERLDNKVRIADSAVGDFSKNVGNYPLKGLATGLKDLVEAFGVTAGIGAVATVLKGAFDTYKEFEQGVADLSAITGASGKDLEFLKKQSIELGKTTKGGAIAVVEAYKLIASAKPELLENVESLNAVTDATITLAKASGLELPEAATALTDAMNQFGAPAEEASVFIDALANGAKFGAAEIPQVTEALLKFGAVARSSNISIQESTALIELLAENGIKGADAGTALRNVLLKISAPDALPKEAQKALKDLGISFETLKDKSVPIQEKFEALRPLLADNGKLLKAFGFENTVAARNIIEHTDRLKVLTGKMNEFGTAEEQAAIKSNTLQGKTDILVSTYDSLVLSLTNGSGAFSGFFKGVVSLASYTLNALMRLNSTFDELIEKSQKTGSDLGKKSFDKFSRGLSDEDLTKKFEKNRKSIFEERNRIEDEIEKTQSRINELESSTGGKNGLAGGALITTLKIRNNKQDLEKLKGEQSQIESFINSYSKLKRDKNKEDKTITEDQIDLEKNGIENSKKANSDYLKILKENYEARKKIANDEFNLNQFELEQLIEINEEISKDEKESADIRVEALYNSFQLRKTLVENELKRQLELQGTYNEKSGAFERDLSNKQIQEIINTGKTSEALTDEQQLFYEKFQKNKTAITKDESNKRQAIIDSEVAKVQKLTDAKLLEKDTDLKDEESIEFDRFKVELINAQGNQKLIQEATEAHERKLLDIKRRYAKDALNIQLTDLENLLKSNYEKLTDDKISATERNKIVNKIAGFRKDINEIDVATTVDANNRKKLSDQEYADRQKEISQKIYDLSFQLKDALVGLANTIFDAKIQNIDFEIQKNDEYYSRQIELAGNDERQKDLLQKERDRKNLELENKKRREAIKQAVFNKVLALADIALNTTKSVMAIASTGGGTYYADFGISAATLTAITIALGAAKAATVLATPLPKYKMGRKGGPEEMAIINDGGVTEVVERKRGGIDIFKGENQLVKLYEGDTVHKSVDDYNQIQRQNMINAINKEGKRMTNFTSNQYLESAYSKEMLQEMRLTRKAIERNKIVFKTEKIDFGHEIWKMKNVKWD